MELCYSQDLDLNLVTSQMPGCSCLQGICSIDSCQCMLRGGEPAYDFQNFLKRPQDPPPIFECNDECSCFKSECINRVVQNCLFNHPSLDIITKSNARGRGVVSKCPILKGTCLGVYFGEVITPGEAESREKSRLKDKHNYILTVREIPKFSVLECSEIKTIVDGDPNLDFVSDISITSLINHSCDPNLTVYPVRVNSPIPYLSFFALRDIDAHEEVSYDYGFDIQDSAVNLSSVPCLCNSCKCRGYLPTHSYPS